MTVSDLWITIGSLILSAVISGVVGTILKKSIETKMDKSLADQKELVKLREEKELAQHKEEMVAMIKAEMQPLNAKLDIIESKLDANTTGTVTLMREMMKLMRDQYVKQGYASSSDVASWHQLYDNYVNLGGNSLKAFVMEWGNDVDSLPREVSSNKTQIDKK